MALDVVECCKSVHNQADIGAIMESLAYTGNNGSSKPDAKRGPDDRPVWVVAVASKILNTAVSFKKLLKNY